MHITVIGATGRTGSLVVDTALERGHTVTALARSALDRSWKAGVTPVGGSVLDPRAVQEALNGSDAVIVAISMVRSSDFPWAPILTPRDLHVRAVGVVSDIALEHGPRRYVTISAHGVGESESRAGWLFMALVNNSNIGVAYADLARAEEALAQTGLDWTVVRPTRLTNGPRTGEWVADPELQAGNRASISRRDVALFLVQCAESDAHLHERVSLTSA